MKTKNVMCIWLVFLVYADFNKEPEMLTPLCSDTVLI